MLYLLEGLLTVVSGVLALLLLPEDIKSCRWLGSDEKEYCESTDRGEGK